MFLGEKMTCGLWLLTVVKSGEIVDMERHGQYIGTCRPPKLVLFTIYSPMNSPLYLYTRAILVIWVTRLAEPETVLI
jgi:hypothetical protein